MAGSCACRGAAWVLFAGSAVAAAAPPPLDAPPAGTDLPLSTFVELDRNADGVVAQDELPAGHSLMREFERFDADDDRRIDRDEFERYLAGGDDLSEDVDGDDEDRK